MNSSSSSSSSSSNIALSESQQQLLLDRLQVFKVRGRDKRGRNVLQIIGKLFPARFVNGEVLKKYLEEKMYPKLEEMPFSVVYLHTNVHRCENCPGIATLRWIYEALPSAIKTNLEAVYFVHPDLQSRLFLATFGRFLFTGGLYGKVKYMNRLEFLWEHVKRKEMGEMPEFVYDHDEELDHRPMMDYGMETDHLRVHHDVILNHYFEDDSTVPTFSTTRCIA